MYCFNFSGTTSFGPANVDGEVEVKIEVCDSKWLIIFHEIRYIEMLDKLPRRSSVESFIAT